MKPIRALTLDFNLITQSMRDISRRTADYYLDKTTGKVVSLSRDLICALAQDRSEGEAEVPAWDAHMIPLARQIVLAGSPNYIRIPEAFGQPEHCWMVAFTADVKIPKMKQKIFAALRGRGCRMSRETACQSGGNALTD